MTVNAPESFGNDMTFRNSEVTGLGEHSARQAQEGPGQLGTQDTNGRVHPTTLYGQLLTV